MALSEGYAKCVVDASSGKQFLAGRNTLVNENKMGTMPENRLLLTMASPTIVSMFVQALYSIIDSIFVAQLGESALTAVSLAFPAQSLIYAVAVGTGVGMNSILSKGLGQKDTQRINSAAANGVFLMLLVGTVSC
jgi:Na+-driven multidrug efflux pump